MDVIYQNKDNTVKIFGYKNTFEHWKGLSNYWIEKAQDLIGKTDYVSKKELERCIKSATRCVNKMNENKTRFCRWCGDELRIEDDMVCGYHYLED